MLNTDLKVFRANPATLKPHPRNVRVHPEDNILAIMTSLISFGQQKPIVVDALNQVIAGNGTLESFTRLSKMKPGDAREFLIKKLNWTVGVNAKVATWANEFATIQYVKTNLTGIKAEAFAIADNKTSDMSEFNYELLAEVMKTPNMDLISTGFKSYELEPLLEADWTPGEPGTMPEKPASQSVGTVSVHFTPEQWELVKPAIEAAKEHSKGYETDTDGAALSVFCYICQDYFVQK